MKRVNGFLNLDDYFENVVASTKNNNIIFSRKSEYPKTNHYWLRINGEDYYFKQTDGLYEELVATECAKLLGIEAVEYDLAIYRNFEGVISKSYRKKGCTYISGAKILFDYLCADDNLEELKKMGYKPLDDMISEYEVDESEKIHTLEVIWQALEYRYGQSIDIEKVMSKFTLLFIFNILVGQHDGMPQNWEIEESVGGIDLMPFIDAELCFISARICPKPSGSLAPSFSNKEGNNYLKLKQFLMISSDEFVSVFLEKFELLSIDNFKNILASVEQKIGRKMPEMTYQRLLNSFASNRNNIESLLSEMKISGRGIK